MAHRTLTTINEEAVDLIEYHDHADIRRQLGRFLDRVYNRERIPSSLGYRTPAEFEPNGGPRDAARRTYHQDESFRGLVSGAQFTTNH